MCGIIGIIGDKAVEPLLIEGLRRLEYRGYDSTGVATLLNGGIERRRAEGKLVNLEKALQKYPVQGTVGLAHTRWATHGAPSKENAHPHTTDKVAVVHNGIIENFRDLKQELEKAGHVLASQTDTEVIAHLVTYYLETGLTPEQATHKALGRLEGAFAFGLLFAGHDDLIIAARRGSPLAIGFGEGEMYLGSDALVLAPLTRKIMYLEEGDYAVLNRHQVRVFDVDHHPVERAIGETRFSGATIGKGEYPHFMLKEIYEQPQVIGDTIRGFVNPDQRTFICPELPFDIPALNKITLIACGTSYYAAMTAKYWFESIADIAVEADIASEFRYRTPPMPDRGQGLYIFISQSGETADTLAALRYVRERNQHTMAIINVPESAIAREVEFAFQTWAGPEIGVASTKAFTTQLTVLACLSIILAKLRGLLPLEQEQQLANALIEIPARTVEVLKHDQKLTTLAQSIMDAQDVLYLGRGLYYPLALEGALKLKEVSYIHAEGYAAGEMKHGPIALISSSVPVIVVAPSDELFEKTASNIQEVIARGGRVIFLSDEEGVAKLGEFTSATVTLPTVDPFFAPLLYAIPVQLLAYHVAVLRGADVDQPRNLAKCVTVE